MMDTFFYLFLSGGFLAVAAQRCDQAYYENCLSKLQKFADKDDLIFANSEEEFDAECANAEKHATCLTSYSRRCLSLEERDNFTDNIEGIKTATVALCTENGDFRRKYLNIVPCLRNASDEIRFCKDKFERNNRDISAVAYEDKMNMACCSIFGYLQCIHRLMDLQKGCGEDAGDVITNLANRMTGSALHENCRDFEMCKSAASWTPSTEIVTLTITFLFIAFCKYF